MLEKIQKNIVLEDLFSKVKEKNTHKDYISKKEKIDFLIEKKECLDKLYAPLEMNDKKNKIIEISNNFTYKKDDILKWYTGIYSLITETLSAFFYFTIIGGLSVCAFGTMLALVDFVFGGEKETHQLLNVIYFISIQISLLTLLILNGKISKLKSLLESIDEFIVTKITNILNKIFSGKKHKETLEYYNAELKPVLYYENKTGDELYDKFLLEEIYLLKRDQKVKNWSRSIILEWRNQAIANANEKYKKYLNEKKEFGFLEKLIKMKPE